MLLPEGPPAVSVQLKGNVDAFPIPIWAAVLISLILVPLTGLFAGLTLGLLSLDRVGLRVSCAETPVLLGCCQNVFAPQKGIWVHAQSHTCLVYGPALCLRTQSSCTAPSSHTVRPCSWMFAIQILVEGGDPQERLYAQKILPGMPLVLVSLLAYPDLC